MSSASTTKFEDSRWEIGVLWSDDQLNFQAAIKLPRGNLGLYNKGSVKMMK